MAALPTNSCEEKSVADRKLSRINFLGATLLCSLGWQLAQAHHVTVTEDNSALTFDHGAADIFGIRANAVDWVVDGRRILTYVSSPANLIDVAHHHSDAHVSGNAIHAAGQILGGPSAGGLDISGGIVYTLDGAAAASGVSRLTEVVELTLGTSITSPITLGFTGFGFQPSPHGGVTFEMPDLSGLLVTGTTLLFAQTGSFSIPSPGFGHLTILPFHSFTGFNTFRQDLTLAPGSTVRFITELNVSNIAPPIPEPETYALMLAGLGLLAVVARRRRVTSSLTG